MKIIDGKTDILPFHQGLYPESHGVIDNNMYDESIGAWFGMSKPNASDPRWWKGEPVSKETNLQTAIFPNA